MEKGVRFMNKKQFTKIFSFILTLSVMAAMIIPSFAAKTVNLKLDIAGEKGKVFVRLTAPEGSDIATMSCAIKFDTSKLTYNSVSYLTDMTILSATNDKKAAEGIVSANMVLADSITAESKIFTYVFDVKDGADGEIAFDFTDIEATDSNDNPINITFDGAKSAVISELEPLTPDVVQPDFTAPSSTEPEPTESKNDSEEDTTAKKNADSPIIPSTSGRIIAVSSLGVAAVAAVAGVVIYTTKKKKED